MLDVVLGISILLLLAAVIILWPVVFARRSSRMEVAASQRALNIAVYKDRIAELEADLEQGQINSLQFSELKAELESNLLTDVNEKPESSDRVQLQRMPRLLLIVLLITLPALSWGLYWKWGAYNALADARSGVSTEAESMPPGDIEQLLVTLQQKLEENPDNVEGWILLSRSYMNMGRYEEAISSLKQVARLFALQGEDNTAVRGMIAQAMYFNQQEMTPDILAQLTGILEENPEELNSLGLMGMYSFEQKEFEQAANYWQKILLVAPDHPSRDAIQAGIDDARAMLGENVSLAQEVPASAASLEVSVDIEAALKDKSEPTDTLFVYARAINGPKMPLAIVKKQFRDLPLTVTLDDSMAMGPMAKLSSVDEVEIVARVSKTGIPAPSPGDLEGSVAPVKTLGNTDSLRLVIDRVVQ